MPTEYVHSETDGLILLEMILKVSIMCPSAWMNPVDNIGSTIRGLRVELWAILTLRAYIKPLEPLP